MRETVNTLRVYFGLAGAYALISGIRALSSARILPGIVGICFGIAYIHLAVRMPQLLRDSLVTIKWVLVASSTFLAFALLSVVLLGHAVQAVWFALAVAINWYLYRNAKRLSAELQSSPLLAQAPTS
jgi:hypothetical protein